MIDVQSKNGKAMRDKAVLHQDVLEDTSFVTSLKDCSKRKDLCRGLQVHADILQSGLIGKSPYVANTLVSMYAKCGALTKARHILGELPVRNVVSWSALILEYAQQGCGEEALNCFELMQREGLSPNVVTFIGILKACGSMGAVDKGEFFHEEIARQGFLGRESPLGNALVDMYAKCGSLAKAQRVLYELPVRDVVAWSALIAGYCQQRQGQGALDCFERMQKEGLFPDEITFASILKACASIGAFEKGSKIHEEIARLGLLAKNPVLGGALVDMYAKCGALLKAKQVLEELAVGDVVSWSALIAGYTQWDQGEEALSCFEKMQCKGLSPNMVTFISALKACGDIGAIDKGEQIHDEIVRQGLLERNMALGCSLVDMYAKCGALAKAQQMLGELPIDDVIPWNALITGYAQKGEGEKVIECFEIMQAKGLFPNEVTFTCVLKACGIVRAAEKGKQIHDAIARLGLLQNNIMLGTALVDMYAKCGELEKAQRAHDELLKRNVVSWSVLIRGYVEHSQAEDALNCFEKMQHEELSPDAVTFGCILKACGITGAVKKGEHIHNQIAQQGLLAKDLALGNALVDMYAKCSEFGRAKKVLEELPFVDAVSWSALIAGYVQQGQGEEALHCFELMQQKGISPDEITFSCILKACGNVGAAEKGKQIHDEIIRLRMSENNVVLGTALVDMYAKCGALERARQVLDQLPVGNAVSWSALIAGYAQQGQCHEAVNCLEQMRRKGIPPDEVSLSCVLHACSHAGLVDKGEACFIDMIMKYGVTPGVEHYTCMVDLFGRAGHFDKAVAMIKRMPSGDYPVVWSALLGACRKWGEVKIGRWAFDHAIQLDKSDPAPYLAMACIYTAADMMEEARQIKAMRVHNKAWKKPGHGGWRDANESLDVGMVGDKEHAQRQCEEVLSQKMRIESGSKSKRTPEEFVRVYMLGKYEPKLTIVS